MNIRLKPVWIALALATGAAQAAPVHDWDIGAGAGWAWAHDLDDFSKDVSNDDTAYNAFAGYNFTENLGAELGYLSGGDWDVNGHEFSNQGATLSILGRLPLNDIFSVFAEGGGYLYSVKSINGSEDNLAPLAGLGMTARLHDWIDIQARYRYMVRVGDDSDNDKVGSGTQRWVSDISTATIELVLHPNRTVAALPVAAPMVVAPPPAPELLAAAPCPRAISTRCVSSAVSMSRPLIRLSPARRTRFCSMPAMTWRALSSSMAAIKARRLVCSAMP